MEQEIFELILQARADTAAAFEQVSVQLRSMQAELEMQTRLAEASFGQLTQAATQTAQAHVTAAQRVRTAWSAIGSQLSGVLNPLGLSKGLVFDLALGDTVKQAGDFEQAMLKIKALSEATPADVAQWGPALIQMSEGTTQSAKQLADGLFFVASSGYHAGDALKVLDAIQMSAAAGLGNMGDTANLVVSAMNAYGMSADHAIDITDKLKKAVIEGHMEPGQLVPALGRTLPLAASANIPIDEVLAMIATQTRMGATPSVAATGIRTMITGLLKPTATARQTLKELGFHPEDIANDIKGEGGLSGFLGDVFKRSGGDTRTLLNIFGNQRSATEALGLAKGGGETSGGPGAIFQHIENEIRNNSGGTTQTAFQTTMTGFNAQTKEMVNTFQAAAITIGSTLLPGLSAAFKDVAQGMTNVVSVLNTVITGLGRLAAMIGINIQPGMVLGSVLGVYLAVQLVSVSRSVLQFVANLGSLTVNFARVAVAAMASASATVSAWVAAAGPVLIVVGAIIAAAALIYVAWTQNWGGIQQFVGGVVDWITGKISGFLDWMASHGLGVSSNWRDQWSEVGNAVGGVANNLGGVKDNALGALGALKDQVAGAFTPGTGTDMNTIMAGLKDQGDQLPAAVPNLADAKNAVTDLQNQMKLAQDQFDLSQIESERTILDLKRQQLQVDAQMVEPNQRIRDLQIDLREAAQDQVRLKNEQRMLELDAANFGQNAELKRVNLQIQQAQDMLQFTRSPSGAGSLQNAVQALQLRAFNIRRGMFGSDFERLSAQTASDAQKLGVDIQSNRINQQLAAVQASTIPLERQASAIQAASQTAQNAADIAKNVFDQGNLSNKTALLGAQIQQATIQTTNYYNVEINNPVVGSQEDADMLVDTMHAGLREAAASGPPLAPAVAGPY